jgi:exonuclease VII large subunit
MQVQKPVVVDDSIVNYYRERCSRLEGELHDTDRKVRLQVDEIMQLKRELSKDRTETLLSHQQQLSDLKDAHRNEIERLKENHRRDCKEFEKQINELERQAFKREMEQRSGDRSTGNRLLDMFEEVAPKLFENVSEILGGALTGQVQPGLPAAIQPRLTQEQTEQLRHAFEEDMAGSAPNGHSQHNSPITAAPAQNSGEEPETPHRPFSGDESPAGLNDFFAEKRNGHPEREMEGTQ